MFGILLILELGATFRLSRLLRPSLQHRRHPLICTASVVGLPSTSDNFSIHASASSSFCRRFWCDMEETTKESEHTLLQDFTDKEMFCSDPAYDKSLQQLKCFLRKSGSESASYVLRNRKQQNRYTLISDPNSNSYFDLMIKTNLEILKRWNNEVQEVVQSRVALVQFHALVQLHQIRQNDQLDVSKLVTSLTRGTVPSPLAQCLLICYTSQDFRVVLDKQLRLILKLRDMMKGFRASSDSLMMS
ncbi:unnamed protein product [Lactuca saligna]|uniref:Uncharacterized protein n=1 Tax=Lactuca saligna TaxID=75948 RepID=A0AA35VDK4_LACSI|nr:unnamed protein product [Lactuca saligna]